MSSVTSSCRERSGSEPAGFTLLEMVVVIAIVTFLAGAIAVALPRIGDDVRGKKTVALLAAIDTAIANYYNSFHRYPLDARGAMTAGESLAWHLTTEFGTPEDIAEVQARSPARAARMVVVRSRYVPIQFPSGALADIDGNGERSFVDGWGRDLLYDEAPKSSDFGGRRVNPFSFELWSAGPDGVDDREAGDDLVPVGER